MNPNRSPDRKSEAVAVVTADKHRLSGLIRNEDNFVLILQTEDGSFHSFSKEQIAHLECSGDSLMPDDYQNKLSTKEIDDLINYLLNTGAHKQVSSQKEDSEEE